MPVVVRNRLRHRRIRLSIFARIAQNILDMTGEPGSELSLELIGNQRMRRLNREFRGRDQTTDVLAFPIREGPGPTSVLLGDVVIAMPVAICQASRYQCSVDEELVRLLLHGVLHLEGYDHERGEQEARRMRRKEQAVLRAIQPYPRFVDDMKPTTTRETIYEMV